jgi:hypothetical protein
MALLDDDEIERSLAIPCSCGAKAGEECFHIDGKTPLMEAVGRPVHYQRIIR